MTAVVRALRCRFNRLISSWIMNNRARLSELERSPIRPLMLANTKNSHLDPFDVLRFKSHNFEAFVLWRVFDVVSWIETWIYRDPNWCVTFKSFFSEFVFDRMNNRAAHRHAQNITFCVIHRNWKCVCFVHSPLNSICFLIMSSLLDTYFRATSCHVCLFTFRCLSRPILLEANWLGWRAENGKRQNKSPWIESKRDVLSV